MVSQPRFDLMYAVVGSSPVLPGSTLTFGYIANRSAATYNGQGPALMNVRALQANFIQEYDFTIVYGATSVVVTYNGTTPIPAGSVVWLQAPGADTSDEFDRLTVVETPKGADSQYVFQANTPDRTPQSNPFVVPNQLTGT